jgi:two-component system response regulator YesN
MIKVLVVEDDHLVRRGFIAIMPWFKHGMEVVGETVNGAKALEFLSEHEVDLLITDMAMPVMSGIELMQQVKLLYSHIQIVVLTFHQDFELIQEALRLGALDYIIKVELEYEQMDNVLQRIVDRIHSIPPTDSSDQHRNGIKRTKIEVDSIFTIASLSMHPNKLLIDKFSKEEDFILSKLDDKHWWIEGKGEQDSTIITKRLLDYISPYPDWVLVRCDGAHGLEKEGVKQALRGYLEISLFYMYRNGIRLYKHNVDLLKEQNEISKQKLYELGDRWSSVDWMIDPIVFVSLLDEMAELQLPVARLESIFYMAVSSWRRLLSINLFDGVDYNHYYCWEDWVLWLTYIRKQVYNNQHHLPYSEEIVLCVRKACAYIQHELQSELHLADVAKEVGISRSYFSRCFRDIVGKTFNYYVRDLRIDRAKMMLKQTNKSIGWIASESGYPNEKYFCKVFGDLTGMQPREFRIKGGG